MDKTHDDLLNLDKEIKFLEAEKSKGNPIDEKKLQRLKNEFNPKLLAYIAMGGNKNSSWEKSVIIAGISAFVGYLIGARGK